MNYDEDDAEEEIKEEDEVPEEYEKPKGQEKKEENDDKKPKKDNGKGNDDKEDKEGKKPKEEKEDKVSNGNGKLDEDVLKKNEMIQTAQEQFNTNGGTNMVDPEGDKIQKQLEKQLKKVQGEV